jgi:heptosyltransferase-2
MYKKILVFNPSFLGDSVLTTPLLKALKYYYNEAELFFCVRPEYSELFEGLPYIKKIIEYDKRNALKGIKGIFQFANILKKYEFDLIISAHKSLRTTLVVKFSNATKTIGFKESSLSFLYDQTINRNMSLHEVQRNLMLISPLIKNFNENLIFKAGGKPETFLNKNIYSNVKTYLNKNSDDMKLVGICPASVWKTKMWPAEKYAELINILYDKGFKSVIFGAVNEKQIINKVIENTKVPVINFINRKSLMELTAGIKSVNAIIANDSGPVHIAVSQDVPVVAIFGPTVKSLGFYPYSSDSKIVEINDLECRPCGLHGGNVCPKKHFRCMNDIEVQEVFNAFQEVIN